MEKINVLYISHTRELGGAALSLYNLIRSVREWVNPIILLPAEGQAYEFFNSKGIKCIIHSFRCNIREKSPIRHYIRFIPHYIRDLYFNNICCKNVLSEIQIIGIHIVHSNSSVFTIGRDLSVKLSARHVWHIREFQDLDFGMQPFLGWKNLKKKIYSSDAVIAITKAVYEHWDLDKAKNAYCIWDAVRSKRDAVLQQIKKKYFFFCAAQLSEAKGASFAVEAFGRSGLAAYGYKLVMAGRCDDDYHEKLISVAKRYNVLNQVDFIGYCDDVKTYMIEATAFLMCSKNEGLGRVTVEAMFYGCPVIAKNTGGTIEFIQDEVTGLLFSGMDTCISAMKKVIDTSSANRMIYEALDFAIKNFSEEEYGKSLLKIYRDIILN